MDLEWLKRKDHTGETGKNTYGYLMIIHKYINENDIVVEFRDGYQVHTNYQRFCKGQVRNPYNRTICRFGYVGEGKYNCQDNEKAYRAWTNMIRRCYDKEIQKKYPTYRGCSVCDEWKCFQNFADWYYKNWYEIPGQRMHLDKDILKKGNRVYCPENCCFVPQEINELFGNKTDRSFDLPVGVDADKYGKYRARCSNGTSNSHIAMFNTPEEAFLAYKEAKEKRIREVAEEFKGLIPDKVYRAVINWIVEID